MYTLGLISITRTHLILHVLPGVIQYEFDVLKHFKSLKNSRILYLCVKVFNINLNIGKLAIFIQTAARLLDLE